MSIRRAVELFLAGMRVVILCAYPIAGAAIAFYVVALSDQGIDLLLDAVSQLSWRHDAVQQTLGTHPAAVIVRAILSGCSVFAAALSIWYPARQLVSRDFRFFPIDAEPTRTIRAWLPRVLAMLLPFGAAFGYGRIAWHATWGDAGFQWNREALVPLLLGAMWLAIAAGLGFALRMRRVWWNALLDARRRRSGKPAAAARLAPVEAISAGLSRPAAAWIAAACVSYVVVALAFALWPVVAPRIFGGTALIFFGVGGLTFIVTMTLAYAPLARGYPTLTAIVAIAILTMGTWLDNHGMRPVTGDPSAQARVLAPREREAQWSQAATHAGCARDRSPRLFVAAAGGGIRAAYWTARVLEELSLRVGRDFDCSVFALSGVSGGSLGIAAYVATNRERGVALTGAAASASVSAGADDDASDSAHRASLALSGDFLSPAVGGLLFYDALQRVFPIRVHALDRSRGLEDAFEQAFDPLDGHPFSHPLRALDSGSARMPMMFLNATVVEDGRRAIQSNVDLAEFPDVYDLTCPDLPPEKAPSTASISLASAVHNSARFTYVSPAGHVVRLRRLCHGEPASDARIVDGGYFENSGAATLTQLLCVLHACDRAAVAAPASAPATESEGRPILLLIRNSPGTQPYCSSERADERCISLSADPGNAGGLSPSPILPEIASPLQALLTVREQRERLAVTAAAQAFRDRGGIVVEAYLPLLPKDVPEPPLGWSLSPGVRAGLDRAARKIVMNCRNKLGAIFRDVGEPTGGCDRPEAAGEVARETSRFAISGPQAASAASAAGLSDAPPR